MENIIKVLLIEDDEEDYIFVKEMFEKIKRTKFKLDWVDDYESGEKEIEKNQYDIYLLDYKLGIEDGLPLIEYARKTGCQFPFIVTTGQLNHNTDLRAMEMGAYDYLVKGQFGAESIERSIRYALERKRLEKTIKDEQELLKLVINTTPTGMCLLDTDKKFQQTNKPFLSMFDIREDVTGKSIDDILVFEELTENPFATLKDKPVYCRIELMDKSSKQYKVSHIDGFKQTYCSVSTRTMKIQNGVLKTLYLLTFTDITDQKKTEKVLVKSQKIMEEKISKYGLENNNPEPILDLIDVNLDRLMMLEKV